VTPSIRMEPKLNLSKRMMYLPMRSLCRLPLAANVCELPAYVYKGVQSAL
jgi:hypothetical protein